MNKKIVKIFALIQAAAVSFGIFATGAAAAGGQWVAGDFHTHTYVSDGNFTSVEVAAKAKAYGLDWYSATDHGGAYGRDGSGNGWATGTQYAKAASVDAVYRPTGMVMPRWNSILTVSKNQVITNRQNGIMQFLGFELNAPGHEHASVGLVGDNMDTLAQNLSDFEYMFDSSEPDDKDNPHPNKDNLPKNNSKAVNSINAASYLADKFNKTSYFLPNHPSRKLAWTIADFRDLNDAAPNSFFGAELLPGHQASAFRGGLGYLNMYDPIAKKVVQIHGKTGNTVQEKIDSYVKSFTDPKMTIIANQDVILNNPESTEEQKAAATAAKNEAQNYINDYNSKKAEMLADATAKISLERTWGGADYMLAKIGGLWDTLLSEGRNFWIFGNSDFHINAEKSATIPDTEPDFWPGEYSKNYTYVTDKTYQGILDGMRSGNSYAVLGDLINALDFKVTNGKNSGTMGQTVTVNPNKNTEVTIRFKSPSKNFANSDGRTGLNETPKVDHIDIIAGLVGEKVEKYDPNYTGELPDEAILPAYKKDTVDTTKIIKTMKYSEFKQDADGYMSATFTVPAEFSGKNAYFRLRGTNNTLGNENCDAFGNPTIDTAVSSVTGDNTAAKAFNDLWFYSNPVFVKAGIDTVTFNGTIKNAKGMKLEFRSEPIKVTPDANGKFTVSPLEIGNHSVYLIDDEGDYRAKIDFTIQRGDKTGLNGNVITVKNGEDAINISYEFDGENLKMTGVSDASNPNTGNNVSIALLAALALISVLLLITVKRRQPRTVK